jgi:hypothetical protein
VRIGSRVSGEWSINGGDRAGRGQGTRSSVDIAAKWPIMDERAELLFTFADIFNDFAVEHEIVGQGFTALYQNFLETQVASVGLRVRF